MLDTDLDFFGAKNPNPYCAQMRFKGSHGVFAPSSYPSPAAGEGPSGQVTACFTHSLGSVTFCDWLAETKLKINLISVVASDATFA